LGSVAGAAELPALLSILDKAGSLEEKEAAESAAAAVCVRQTDRATCVETLAARFAHAQGGQRLHLLRILCAAGGPKALAAIRAVASDGDAKVRSTALRAMCDWPTADALPDVARLARDSKDAKVKILALRGYVRLVSQQDAPAGNKLAGLKEALSLAARSEEKRLVLAALGNVAAPESLALVRPHLAAPDLKEESVLALVTIAEKVVTSHPAQVAEALRQLPATANSEVAARVKAVLEKAKRGGR
jgi:hypothetical protein